MYLWPQHWERRGRQEDFKSMLASQPIRIGKPPVQWETLSQNLRWTSAWGRHQCQPLIPTCRHALATCSASRKICHVALRLQLFTLSPRKHFKATEIMTHWFLKNPFPARVNPVIKKQGQLCIACCQQRPSLLLVRCLRAICSSPDAKAKTRAHQFGEFTF